MEDEVDPVDIMEGLNKQSITHKYVWKVFYRTDVLAGLSEEMVLTNEKDFGEVETLFRISKANFSIEKIQFVNEAVCWIK